MLSGVVYIQGHALYLTIMFCALYNLNFYGHQEKVHIEVYFLKLNPHDHDI